MDMNDKCAWLWKPGLPKSTLMVWYMSLLGWQQLRLLHVLMKNDRSLQWVESEGAVANDMKAFGATIHGYLSLTLHSWGASISLFPLIVNSKWSAQSSVVWLHVLRGTFSSFFVSFLNWWNLWSSIFLQIPRFPMLVLAHYLLKISKQGQDWISRSAHTTHIWDWTLCRCHYCAAN
jgi:hypothetical protein